MYGSEQKGQPEMWVTHPGCQNEISAVINLFWKCNNRWIKNVKRKFEGAEEKEKKHHFSENGLGTQFLNIVNTPVMSIFLYGSERFLILL